MPRNQVAYSAGIRYKAYRDRLWSSTRSTDARTRNDANKMSTCAFLDLLVVIFILGEPRWAQGKPPCFSAAPNPIPCTPGGCQLLISETFPNAIASLGKSRTCRYTA